jgi:branched-chain amino acid transport system permease protein
MPETFGFVLLTDVLAYVILGGSLTVLGPLVGAAILTLLPEIARPLADNRMILMGMILVFVMLYLPHGVADSLRLIWRQRRRARAPQALVPEVQADG